MRLQTLAAAAAISLLLVPPTVQVATPFGLALAGGGGNNTTAPPTLTILSPADGGRLEPGQAVLLRYDHPAAPPGRIAGEVRLDGERIGTFLVTSNQSQTFLQVVVDLGGFADGPHALDASAWTDADAAVDAGPIAVDVEPYDIPPVVVTFNVTVTLDPTTVHMQGAVADNDSATLDLALEVGNASVTTAVAPGPFNLTLQTPLPPGWATYRLTASDGIKTNSTSGKVYVPDQAPRVTITSVRHELGGHIVVDGTATDADGFIKSLTVSVGTNTVSPELVNGTFEASLYGPLAVGNVQVLAMAVDNLGLPGSASTIFDVEPIHATVYDRIVTTNLGLTTDSETITLPQAVNASVSFTPSGVQSAEAAVVIEGNATVSDWEDAFGVHASGGSSWGYAATANVQWTLAAHARMEIVISGDFL